MPAMETFFAKHAAKIRGTLACFDRVLFRGYLPLMSGWAMAEFLRSKRICVYPGSLENQGGRPTRSLRISRPLYL